MTLVRPFFLLLARASVFWLSLFAVLSAGLVIVGFSEPDSREVLPDFDTVFASIVVFPLLAGWILGALVQDFQHTTFAYPLPRVRSHTAAGFLLVGLVVSTLVVGAIALNVAEPQNLVLLFAIGFGVYCAAGIFLDPFSAWITTINAVVAFLLFARSGTVARIAGEHPWIVAGVALLLGTIGVRRLFARSTFRRKPFTATAPFPGRFSLERTQRYETQRRLQLRSRRRGWRGAYLGTRPWAWVRAAAHQVYGASSTKTWLRATGKGWGLALIIVVHAWADRGDLSFGQALARTVYDALLRSPYIPPFGDRGGPLGLVLFVIALAGALVALFSPVVLRNTLTYPLSRRARAAIQFRGGLVDAGIFLVVVGPLLLVLGYVAGWFAGYELRLDFMPFTTRVLLVTTIAMPLGYWGRWRLLEAARGRSTNTMIGVIIGVLGFAFVVWVGTQFSAGLFPHALVELGVLLAILVVTRWVHARVLVRHFRTADLI